MKELFVYICAIFVALYVIFVAMNIFNGNKAFYIPKFYEGIENADSSKSANPKTSSATVSVTGVGATSQLYSQTITTAISALETELSMDAYSEQYLTILDNLKTLYKQRALKTALQTPTAGDNTMNQFPLYLYNQNIETLEMLEDFINNRKKSAW